MQELSRQVFVKVHQLASSCAPDTVGTEMELKNNLEPRAAAGRIIGKDGNKIKQIRDSSGATISMGDHHRVSGGLGTPKSTDKFECSTRDHGLPPGH